MLDTQFVGHAVQLVQNYMEVRKKGAVPVSGMNDREQTEEEPLRSGSRAGHADWRCGNRGCRAGVRSQSSGDWRRRQKHGIRRQARAAWFFLAPSLAGVIVFTAVPFVDVVRRSFLDAMGRTRVGLANYAAVCGNTAFRLAASNTVRFLAFCLPLLMLTSFALALLVFRRDGKGNLYKTTLVLPMVIPVAAMVLVWKIVFCQDGLLNELLNLMAGVTGGLGVAGAGEAAGRAAMAGIAEAARGAAGTAAEAGEEIAAGAAQVTRLWDNDWVNSSAAFPILIITYIWKNAGYDLLLWLAGLASISESLYDAARVDGAGAWARLRYITLPGLSGTFGLVLILSVVNSFRVYREAYLLAGSYPDMSIYMIPHLFSHWFLTLDVQNMCTGSMLLVTAALAIAAAAGLARFVFRRLGKSG